MKDKQSLGYDYLIVATGSQYRVPFTIKIDWEQPKEEECRVLFPYDSKQILSNQEAMKNAKHIAIVGTGPVGVEIIGEIAKHYKNTKVTALTHASRLLERQSPSAHKIGMSYFKEFKNLEVLFNRSVTKIEGKKIFFKKSETEMLTKNLEESLDVDIVVVCVGLFPVTDIFKSLMSDSLNVRGYVEVNEFFQIKYGQNHWSIKKFEKEKEKSDNEYRIESQKLSETIPEDSNNDKQDDNDESELQNIMESMYTSLEDKIDPKHEFSDVYPNIFAIGDIANITDEKLAYFSMEHGKRVAMNIKAAEYSKSVSTYKESIIPYKSGKSALQIISFGKKAIIMKGFTMFARGTVAANIKNAIEKYSLQEAIIE